MKTFKATASAILIAIFSLLFMANAEEMEWWMCGLDALVITFYIERFAAQFPQPKGGG